MRVGVEALCAMVLLSAGIFLCVEISWVGNGLKWWDTRPMARGVQGSVILVVACTVDMSVIGAYMTMRACTHVAFLSMASSEPVLCP